MYSSASVAVLVLILASSSSAHAQGMSHADEKICSVYGGGYCSADGEIPPAPRTEAPPHRSELHFQMRSFAPFDSFGGGFEGDDRGFSVSDDVSSRVRTSFTYEPETMSVSDLTSRSDPSVWLPTGSTATATPTSRVDVDEDGVSATHAASNPLVPGAPDLDLTTRFGVTTTEVGPWTKVEIDTTMTGDAYPNAEAFVSDHLDSNRIFLHGYESEGGPISGPLLYLPGDAQRDMGSSSVTLYLDQNGVVEQVDGHDACRTINTCNLNGIMPQVEE